MPDTSFIFPINIHGQKFIHLFFHSYNYIHVYYFIYTHIYLPDYIFIFFVSTLGIAPTPVHYWSINICWAVCVWLVQKRYNREQNSSKQKKKEKKQTVNIQISFQFIQIHFLFPSPQYIFTWHFELDSTFHTVAHHSVDHQRVDVK